MTKALLPQAFWFRIAAACPRVDEMPLVDRRKRLLELPASCILPEGARLEGRTPWAEVRVGWNLLGLGVVVRAEGFGDPKLAADQPEGFADVQLWVDTRDTRDVSRATRFCHRFAAAIRRRIRAEARRRGRPETDRPRDCRPADGPERPDRIPGREPT